MSTASSYLWLAFANDGKNLIAHTLHGHLVRLVLCGLAGLCIVLARFPQVHIFLVSPHSSEGWYANCRLSSRLMGAIGGAVALLALKFSVATVPSPAGDAGVTPPLCFRTDSLVGLCPPGLFDGSDDEGRLKVGSV